MTQIILNMHHWVNLPIEVRYRIRTLFAIPQSSNTVVNDGVLETDGTTIEDFKHLTLEKMQKFLGNDSTDFHKQFDLVVAKVMDDLSNGRQSTFEVIEQTDADILKAAKEIINANTKKNVKKSKQN
jgi:hypothetical protein